MDHLEGRLISQQERLEASLTARNEAILREHPVADQIALFDDLPPRSGYAAIPEQAEALARKISAKAGPEAVEDYNKLTLLVLMRQFEARSAVRNLTPALLDRFGQYFEALLSKMERSTKNYYLYENDAFLKDLAVSRMKLWPCGVELADECGGFPRGLLFKGGLGQLLAGLPFFLLRAGGFGPFFETHFDPRNIRDFTAEGYERLYQSLADLLEINPQIGGVMGSSWWHDPAIERVSPELWFLTREPLLGGAKLFRVGTDSTAAQDATKFSVARNKLYEEGRYFPTVFMLVWLRKDLLSWAEKRGGS